MQHFCLLSVSFCIQLSTTRYAYYLRTVLNHPRKAENAPDYRTRSIIATVVRNSYKVANNLRKYWSLDAGLWWMREMNPKVTNMAMFLIKIIRKLPILIQQKRQSSLRTLKYSSGGIKISLRLQINQSCFSSMGADL